MSTRSTTCEKSVTIDYPEDNIKVKVSRPCEKSVTIDYPEDNIKVKVSRRVYPDDPDEPGCTVFTVEVGNGAAQAMFTSLRDLERYHKAIGYFLDQIDKEGGEI